MAKVTVPVEGGESDEYGERDPDFGTLTVDSDNDSIVSLTVTIETKAGSLAFQITKRDLVKVGRFFE